ncbi:MAG: hypothetical protein K6T83_13405, partial [Alicyclobacillus sp.]|nr:hypothetical protein [Alicyclobacillus sp.]
MCTKGTCMKYLGGWVQFRTPWGYHRGVIESVNDRAVLMRVPRQYAPVGLVSRSAGSEQLSDQERLDLTLAQWGYPGYAGWGYPGWGARWGYPGWG